MVTTSAKVEQGVLTPCLEINIFYILFYSKEKKLCTSLCLCHFVPEQLHKIYVVILNGQEVTVLEINDFCTKLEEITQVLEKHTNIEECLNELASMSAGIIHVKNCSIMLLDEETTSCEKKGFRVFANFGYLPGSVFCRIVKIDEGIANYVARTGTSLIVKDILKSPFSSMARHVKESERCFISAPILAHNKVIGVINISSPCDGRILDNDDLVLVKIVALIIGKSAYVSQIQNLLNSRYAQAALVNKAKDQIGDVSLSSVHEPGKVAKILAKTFYKEMTKAGFGPDHIIDAATEIISLLNDSLKKHKKRLKRNE